MYEPLLDRWKGRSPGKNKENKDARKDKPLAHLDDRRSDCQVFITIMIGD